MYLAAHAFVFVFCPVIIIVVIIHHPASPSITIRSAGRRWAATSRKTTSCTHTVLNDCHDGDDDADEDGDDDDDD